MTGISELINGIAAAAEKNADVSERDFMKDGLLHCGDCGTPKQCRVNYMGRERTVYCLCECATERRNILDAERKAQDEAEKIRHLRTQGIQDKQIRNWTFENDDGNSPDMMGKATRYYNRWAQMYEENVGLLLWGNVGTGKTYFAAAIANALINGGVSALMTNFSKIINALSGFSEQDKNGYIDSLNRYKLLVIDDLGAERQSGFAQEIVYNVIDARYKSGRPLIVTTNLQLDELKNPPSVTCSRIYDRILEMCVPIQFSGESRRKAVYRDKLAKARAFFE